jgi:hypothetical protein
MRTHSLYIQERGANLGQHLGTPNPVFDLGFIPRICYIKGWLNPGLNPGFGVLRCGLCFSERLRDSDDNQSFKREKKYGTVVGSQSSVTK